ncbi:hypothetical protein T440DRAFT_233548 [Plenodomus tracheiphilus IPT5]|uniref:Uncharacterized protein n=1 Tax=Plenodomus tracheiphilus IPT5 TaxID=1408161 RepID=A0A6A7AUB8_9PLEO|nr:hypothetical protein T440DRAFT_233548 [Plenodomus tracheiphilus IPT5]
MGEGAGPAQKIPRLRLEARQCCVWGGGHSVTASSPADAHRWPGTSEVSCPPRTACSACRQQTADRRQADPPHAQYTAHSTQHCQQTARRTVAGRGGDVVGRARRATRPAPSKQPPPQLPPRRLAAHSRPLARRNRDTAGGIEPCVRPNPCRPKLRGACHRSVGWGVSAHPSDSLVSPSVWCSQRCNRGRFQARG